MRSLLWTSFILFTTTTQANPSIWSGFYVGGFTGGFWGNATFQANTNCPDTNGWVCSLDDPDSLHNKYLVDATGSGTVHPNHLVGGLQTGYNLQKNNFVFGPEFDFSSLNLNKAILGTVMLPAFDFDNQPVNIVSSLKTDWLITARARAGFSVNNLLPYVTGGFAMTNLSVSNSYRDTFEGIEDSTTMNAVSGWTVGAGLEWALNAHWSLKAEYLYLDFGSVATHGLISAEASDLSNPFALTARLDGQVAKIGVNYRT